MSENEIHQSEQRIRFFLGLVTGTGAIIGFLSNYFDPFLIASISLPILFVYGILTYSQLIWSSHVIRNREVTRGLLEELIKESDPILKAKIDDADLRDDSQIPVLKDIKGTFAQYMYLTEGLLVVGFVFLIGLKYYQNNLWIIIIVAVFGFIINTAIMLIWGNKIKNGIKIE